MTSIGRHILAQYQVLENQITQVQNSRLLPECMYTTLYTPLPSFGTKIKFHSCSYTRAHNKYRTTDPSWQILPTKTSTIFRLDEHLFRMYQNTS